MAAERPCTSVMPFFQRQITPHEWRTFSMAIQLNHSIRKFAPSILLVLVGALLTLGAYSMHQRLTREKVSLHAAADAAQYQRALDQGIRSYVQLSRDLAGFIVASQHLEAGNFDAYMRSTDVLREHPGLHYIGYVPRIRRTAQAGSADPDYAYPYLYAYPRDARTVAAQGMDFSAIPARWNAMQQARDSGTSAVTSMHFYNRPLPSDRGQVPIIAVFTPIYDLAMPTSTVGERRAALRGYVFSIYEIEQMIERVMGPRFEELFDLEIYDGDARQRTVLYDGDKRPHVVMQDEDFPIAHRADLKIGEHTWQMYFFPKPFYTLRYSNGFGTTIVLLGLFLTAAMGYGAPAAIRRFRSRSQQLADAHRFDEVFQNHPSPVYALDLQRRFINVNAHALKEFKVSRADLMDKSVENLIAPENTESAREHFQQVLRGNTVSYDSAVIGGDGVRVEVCVIMIPVKVAGRVVSVLGIAENITERKLAEWRLNESKRMLQLVIDHLPQRVFWKDTDSKFLGCNEAACRDAGLTHPDQIVGKTDFDLAWRANAEAYRSDDRATLASGQAKINYEEPQQRDDGSESWLRTSKIPLTDINGRAVAVLGMYEDITDRKLIERQLEEMAHFDSLTGLANRAYFHHQLEHARVRAKRNGATFALMYLDLDKFKAVNDTYGHEVGDRLLKAFAHRVKGVLREADTVARLGGDEFALTLEDLPDREAAKAVAAKLVATMQAPFVLDGVELCVGTSIGVAFSSPDISVSSLVRRADEAMYRAKRGGRNRYEVDEN
ncbi:diguanylate cyclase [Massilia sp. R2A-15]|uniref:sensor domain-containing diguanylate cyclase n=1 Tax=Massilia sp. R2A-15 TaxID=3064278 RepID=UPI0027351FCE|nr:diguanylate cyclase [Massilia sp. R2A-15]WLI90783.1 diguanylate cyclase [Massilia sp. R2A-15]